MVVLQEDCQRDGAHMTITGTPDGATNIRPAGCDFQLGDSLPAPRRLSPMDVALLAAMNIAQVPVARRPVVALISTGDELVVPGETPGPDQIIASNTFGLAAMLQSYGAQTRILPIARDNMEALHLAFSLAEGADVIVTIGGASVGDHGGGRCHGFQSLTSPCHSSVLSPDLGTCLRRGGHASQKKENRFHRGPCQE